MHPDTCPGCQMKFGPEMATPDLNVLCPACGARLLSTDPNGGSADPGVKGRNGQEKWGFPESAIVGVMLGAFSIFLSRSAFVFFDKGGMSAILFLPLTAMGIIVGLIGIAVTYRHGWMSYAVPLAGLVANGICILSILATLAKK